jgi:hypothetical protein
MNLEANLKFSARTFQEKGKSKFWVPKLEARFAYLRTNKMEERERSREGEGGRR